MSGDAPAARLKVGTTAPSSAVARFVEPLRLAFFRSFFALLLGAIALSEWVVGARILARAGVAIPLLGHLAGASAVFAFNRWLLRRLRTRTAGTLISFYTAVAFTCVFGGAFVGLAELGWALANGSSTVLQLTGLTRGGLSAWQGAFDASVDLGLCIIAALFLFGYTAGRRRLAVTALRVDVPGLPEEFAGTRIVHLSDLHIGRYLGLEELRRHVERVNGLDPDLVCITGDLVDRAETCGTAFPVLAGLRARHGVFVILGNHDVAAGAEAVTAALRAHTPFQVLRNARADVRINGASLALLGLDDLGRDWARGVLRHPALPPLAETVEDGVPTIVLSHRPDCFDQAVELGASLMLSGHTHGGQLGLPALRRGRVRNLAEFITRYDRGVFYRGDATLVVSNGLGFTGQPVRLFTAREIGCIELRPA